MEQAAYLYIRQFASIIREYGHMLEIYIVKKYRKKGIFIIIFIFLKIILVKK